MPPRRRPGDGQAGRPSAAAAGGAPQARFARAPLGAAPARPRPRSFVVRAPVIKPEDRWVPPSATELVKFRIRGYVAWGAARRCKVLRLLGREAMASWGITPAMCVKTGRRKVFWSVQWRKPSSVVVWTFRLPAADAATFASANHPKFRKSYATLKLLERRRAF